MPNLCLLQHLLATLEAEKLLQTGYAKQLHVLKDSLQASFCPKLLHTASEKFMT